MCGNVKNKQNFLKISYLQIKTTKKSRSCRKLLKDNLI